MKFENIRTYGWESAFKGMRNPLESWHRSDSAFGYAVGKSDAPITLEIAKKYAAAKDMDCEEDRLEETNTYFDHLRKNGRIHTFGDIHEYAYIGPDDMRVAKTLIRGGSEHRKFLRQIFVSVDITAPLYW